MNGKMKIVIAMLIYGSIGVFVRNIDLSAIEIAFLRACIGSLFLIVVSLFLKKSLEFQLDKKGKIIFFISGAALGINWFFLFRAFEYTSVSNAILIYYLAPTIVILMSPLVLGEKLTVHKCLCMIVAIIGLSMIVLNNFNMEVSSQKHLIGIGFALLAAVFYAGVILTNKRIPNTDGLETTTIQLIASVIILFPILITNISFQGVSIQWNSVWLIIILGVLHTGIAYLLYFSSMKVLDGQTVAIYCYIDPISAMLFAGIFLGEKMNIIQITGGIFILGAAYFIDFGQKNGLESDIN